jgi:hypothetical protein
MNSATVDETALPVYFVADWVRYYAPPANLITNGSFANVVNTNKPAGWTVVSGSGQTSVQDREDTKLLDGDSAAAPGKCLLFRNASDNSLTVMWKQTVTGLADGLYTIRAMAVKGSDTANASLEASGFGGAAMSVAVAASSSWKMNQLTDVPVTNGQCEVALKAVLQNKNDSVLWDCIEFVPQTDAIVAAPQYESAQGGMKATFNIDPRSALYAGGLSFLYASYDSFGKLNDISVTQGNYPGGLSLTMENTVLMPNGGSTKPYLWKLNGLTPMWTDTN